MHGFDGSLRQRAGYISDTQADKVRFGMREVSVFKKVKRLEHINYKYNNEEN
jgi:hypothetical protein